MKLTKSVIKTFELDQKKNGTETALFNLLWQQAAEIMNGIGVVRIRTSTKRK